MPNLTWQRITAVCIGASTPLALAFALPEWGLWISQPHDISSGELSDVIFWVIVSGGLIMGTALYIHYSMSKSSSVRDIKIGLRDYYHWVGAPIPTDADGLASDWQHMEAVVNERLNIPDDIPPPMYLPGTLIPYDQPKPPKQNSSQHNSRPPAPKSTRMMK